VLVKLPSSADIFHPSNLLTVSWCILNSSCFSSTKSSHLYPHRYWSMTDSLVAIDVSSYYDCCSLFVPYSKSILVYQCNCDLLLLPVDCTPRRSYSCSYPSWMDPCSYSRISTDKAFPYLYTFLIIFSLYQLKSIAIRFIYCNFVCILHWRLRYCDPSTGYWNLLIRIP